MRRLLFIAGVSLLAFPAAAQQATIAQPTGCVAGVACQASTVAIGGASIGGDALAVTGTEAVSGTIRTTGGSLRVTNDTAFISLGAANDVILSRPAAATLHLGSTDAAAPVAQTLGVQGVATGTSNVAGGNWILAGSQGTGTGAGGSIILQTAPASTTGSTPNALATAVTIDSTKLVTIAGAIAGGGSTPALTGTCTTGSKAGGNTAGKFTATCTAQTVIFTFANTAPNGWVCALEDITTVADTLKQTAFSQTTCTVSGTTVAADVIVFTAIAF